MISIKTLAAAAAISAGFTLAMPATSQAMPVGPIKVQSAYSGNIVDVNHKKWHKKHGKHKWRESRRWRHHHWARYCDPWDGCYRRRHARFFYPDYDYDEPYYGYGYGYPYGGYYGPGFYGPGIGFSFRIH